MEGVLLPWVIAATILLFVAVYWIYTLEQRVKLLQGKYQRWLELVETADQVSIMDVLARLGQLDVRVNTAEAQITRFGGILPHTIQGHAVVRYQAFSNIGGDQSFSLALVDEHGNGALVSSLHGRDETRVYAKPLTQWRSSHSLSAEEQEALGKARQMVAV